MVFGKGHAHPLTRYNANKLHDVLNKQKPYRIMVITGKPEVV
jgi:hypothetical protein